MERNMRLAIPSMAPGGLEAGRSGHFGRCDCFTLVDIGADGKLDVSVVENLPHTEGGCLAPVNLLADHGVKAIIAGEMGMRPLMGFRNAGIAVYLAGNGHDVRTVVEDYTRGRLSPMSDEAACGGHCGSTPRS